MEKLTRKSFRLMFNELKPMEKLNILLELYENLTIDCTEKADFLFLRYFLNKYIRHKVKYLQKIQSL